MKNINLDEVKKELFLKALKGKNMSPIQLSRKFKGKGTSRVSVARYLKKLKRKGLVKEKLATKRRGKRSPKVYYIR